MVLPEGGKGCFGRCGWPWQQLGTTPCNAWTSVCVQVVHKTRTASLSYTNPSVEQFCVASVTHFLVPKNTHMTQIDKHSLLFN